MTRKIYGKDIDIMGTRKFIFSVKKIENSEFLWGAHLSHHLGYVYVRLKLPIKK